MKIVAITGLEMHDRIDPKTPFHVVRKSYINLVEKMGAAPIVLTNSAKRKVLLSYVDTAFALLVTGGGDIDPKYYRKKAERFTGRTVEHYNMKIDEDRDRAEFFLIREFAWRKKPILGICRGAQMINVAFGGSLTQHLTEKETAGEVHLKPMSSGGWHEKAHDAIIEPKSFLYSILKRKNLTVNSGHHQAIEKLGRGLRLAAQSPSGIIEAIESKKHDRFIIGLQWHPEQMQNETSTKKIFKEFLG